MNSQPTKFHPALIRLHWIVALLLIIGLAMGTFHLKGIPNASPDKIDALRNHMIAGGVLLLLTLIRLWVRIRTPHPPKAATGIAVVDRLVEPVVWLLYGLLFVLAGSGIATSVMAGVPDVVFGGHGALPESFDGLLPRQVHGVVAKCLMALIALHIAAACFHQFIVKDGLLNRMKIGPRR